MTDARTLGADEATFIAAAGSGDPARLLVAAVLLGAGGGSALAAGIAAVTSLAEPTRLGTLSAVFYGCAYVGFAGPFGYARAAQAVGVTVPLAVAAGVVALLAVRLAVAVRVTA